MMNRFVGICCLLVFLSCGDNKSSTPQKEQPVNNAESAPVFQVVVTKLSEQNYGYQILKDGKMIIDQPTIPAIQGNRSFTSEEDALKTGEYLITKLKQGIFPPTLSVEELDSLSVLN